jgi:hypothetical protein
VRYVFAPRDRQFPAFVQPIGDFGRHRLYRVETGGYFGVAGSSLAFEGAKDDWYDAASAWLRTAMPAAGDHATIFFERTPAEYASSAPTALADAPEVLSSGVPVPAPAGNISSESIHGDDGVYEAVARVEDGEALVVLKQTYHPNWRATVDGEPADTVMVMPAYTAVRVPQGAHRVRFEYEAPRSRRVLMFVGAATLTLLALADWRREQLGSLVRRMRGQSVEKPQLP